MSYEQFWSPSYRLAINKSVCGSDEITNVNINILIEFLNKIFPILQNGNKFSCFMCIEVIKLQVEYDYSHYSPQ